MRIAMFADTFHPQMGGLARSLLVSARALRQRGHAVLLAVPRSPRFDPPRGSGAGLSPRRGAFSAAASHPSIDGNRTGSRDRPNRAWRAPLSGMGARPRARAPAVRSRARGPGHVPTPPAPADRNPSRADRGLRAPSPALGARLAHVARRYVRWYYDQCDRVTSPSREIIATMRRDGLRAPASVVANAVALDRPRGILDLFEPRRWPSLPGFTLLSVGRLSAEAHVDEIIHALPSLLTRIPG